MCEDKCPKCGSGTSCGNLLGSNSTLGKRYCRQCGWKNY